MILRALSAAFCAALLAACASTQDDASKQPPLQGECFEFPIEGADGSRQLVCPFIGDQTPAGAPSGKNTTH